jgi:hypothetical protein
MSTSESSGSDKSKGNPKKQSGGEPINKSGAHTQAGQQSQTGGGARQHGQDRPAAGTAGSKSGGSDKGGTK